MKYSIITINFNNCDGLRKTIESVIDQRFQDFEYIIIDGGSTDGSVEVIKEYVDRIDYWVSEPDNGVYNAMNKGIIKAKGEYINFLNSGDYFNNTNVLSDIAKIITADIGVGYYYKGNNKNILFYPYEDATFFHLYRGTFNHQASFLKRTLFEKSLYRENLRIVSDWEFYLRKLIFENCSFQTLYVCVVNFDDTGISNTLLETNKQEREHILAELVPQRIRNDYDKLLNIDYELWDFLPQIPPNRRLQHILCKIIKISIFWGKILGIKK